MKNYLSSEGQRNRKNAGLYEKLMRRALAKLEPGNEVAVIIGHHLTFEFNGDIATENEIPGADTLLFCHDIMGAVFGDHAIDVMVSLARAPVERRDAMLAEWLRRADEEWPHREPFPRDQQPPARVIS